MLLALVPMFDARYVAAPDEGVYSAQALLLSGGDWAGDRYALDVDPTGSRDPLLPAFVSPTQRVPYANHPLYPVVLSVAYRALGTTGLIVVSTAAVWLAAIMTALITRSMSRAGAIPALWLAGLGTPLLYDGYVVLGQALAAAGCALAAWAIHQVLDRRRVGFTPLVIAATAFAAMIRSEGVVLGVTLGAVVLGSSALPSMTRPDRLRRAALGVAVGVSTGVAFLIDNRWADEIYTNAGSSATEFSNAGGREFDPINVFRKDLLEPFQYARKSTDAFALLAIAFVVLTAVALRAAPRSSLIAGALTATAAAAAVTFAAITNSQSLAGFFPAFPLTAFAIIHFRIRSSNELERRLAAGFALTMLGILVTSYGEEGGAFQWGGRFFHILFPLLIPLVVVGVQRASSRLPTRSALGVATCLAIAAFAFGAASLRWNLWIREFSEVSTTTAVTAARSTEQPDSAVIVYASVVGGGGPRSFWKQAITGDPLVLTTSALPELPFVIRDLTHHRYQHAIVVTNIRSDLFDSTMRALLQGSGWQMDAAQSLPGFRTSVATINRLPDT